MKKLHIKSIGEYVPPGRITNEEILRRVEAANPSLSGEDRALLVYGCRRKFEFLGIRTRSCSTDLSTDNFTSMAVKAAKNALRQSGLPAEEIDCVLLAGISNPYREPSGSCLVSRQLGMNHVDYLDINDTCNGFLKGIDLAGVLIGQKNYRNVLVITSENPTELEAGLGMNITVSCVDEMDNRLSGLIIGAGAAAAIISDSGECREILRYAEKRETAHWDSSCIRVPHTEMPETRYRKKIDGFWTDARQISADLINETPQFVRECLAKWSIPIDAIDYVILHQLGNNVTFAILDKCAINHERAPVNTFEEFGNIGTVNIPLNFALAEQKGFFKKDQKILLVNSACGFTFSCMVIRY
jgi:3-oxoacyl-[acyl-carrier-protein] synthase III